MEQFKIAVIYKAKSKEARETFISEIYQSVVNDIRQEKGCIKYDYYLSVDDETKIVLYEIWESREHQKIHMTQPHMQTAMAIKAKYIDSVEIKEI